MWAEGRSLHTGRWVFPRACEGAIGAGRTWPGLSQGMCRDEPEGLTGRMPLAEGMVAGLSCGSGRRALAGELLRGGLGSGVAGVPLLPGVGDGCGWRGRWLWEGSRSCGVGGVLEHGWKRRPLPGVPRL